MAKIVTIKNGVLQGYTNNPELTFQELSSIKGIDGAVCYEVTDVQYDEIEKGYDVSVVDGVVATTKGADALALEQQAIETANNKIYTEIAEINNIKQGKLLVDPLADVTAEEAQIADLITKLQ